MLANVMKVKMKLPIQSPNLLDAHQHLHDRAYAYLKGLLLDGGLSPGDLISTEAVGRALGISRAPVTDAVKRLTADGFLVVLPQIGCRVYTPVPAEVADFYELFASSEALIARFAASRRTSDEAREFARFVENLESDATEQGNNSAQSIAARKRNRAHHHALHALARSPLSANIAASLWDRSDFFVRLAFGKFLIPENAAIAQDIVVRAVVKGDAATAERITRKYLHESGKTVAKLLGGYLESKGIRARV